MRSIWATVLRSLRENKYFSLFALASSLNNIDFTDTKIIINTADQTEYALLEKNIDYFNKLAGKDCFEIIKTTQKEQIQNNEYAEKLKDLFGDKIEIL